MNLHRAKIALALLSSFAITYIGGYAFLSAIGRYRPNVSVMDDLMGPCLCASDAEQWQPALISAVYWPAFPRRESPFFTNALGAMFLPLVRLDQEYWHPNKAIKHGEP